MPSQGSNIPVITVEKLWLDKAGRGIYVHKDAVVMNENKWIKGPYVSGNTSLGWGGSTWSGQILPMPSTMGWLKVTWMSGSAGGVASGYMPIYSANVVTT